jgi:coenzyme F420-reducing hydrogenase alpha subunit
MFTVAKVTETVHALEDSIEIINKLAKSGPKDEVPEVKVKARRAVAAAEVPRSILFDDYTFDEKGISLKANCFINID